MTRVELACRWILLHLFIEQLQRGPNFTRLPPAHYWHGHVNEKVVPFSKNSTRVGRDFVYSRRKWMLDQTVHGTQAVPPPPVPMRMPAKAYVYRNFRNNDARAFEAAKILNSIVDAGGDICGVARRQDRRPVPGHPYCVCLNLEGHRAEHRCEHGTWGWNLNHR